jgi:hypothetical protein
MSPGRPLPALILSAEEREELDGFASSRSLPHGSIARAELVQLAAEGLSNKQIAEVDPEVHLAQEQRPAVAGDLAGSKRRFHTA